MRIVFMGTPPFAATILQQLTQSFEVVGVFTQPDAIRSRGKKLEPSAVKMAALQENIAVYEYATFKDNNALDVLSSLEPDVICVAAYGVILPQAALDIPRFGALNAHASLLPRWRGAAPVERAILAGDKHVGVCIMKMEAGLDTGAYCCSQALDPGCMDATEITHKLALLGASALVHIVETLEACPDEIQWISQDESLVTYANKIEKNELNINPEMSAAQALAAIRASSENHPSKCCVGGKDIAVVGASIPSEDEQIPAGISAGSVAFVAKKLYLGFADGLLELNVVHPSGKRQMTARDFAAGLQGVKQGKVTWCAYGC